MKKDIEIPVAKDVYVAIVPERDKAFLSKEWNAYVINNGTTAIEMVLAVSKGFDGDRRTSVMRHAIGTLEAKSFKKIEGVQEDVLALNNEFFVTYFADNKLYEKRFLFNKGTVNEEYSTPIPIIGKKGILAK